MKYLILLLLSFNVYASDAVLENLYAGCVSNSGTVNYACIQAIPPEALDAVRVFNNTEMLVTEAENLQAENAELKAQVVYQYIVLAHLGIIGFIYGIRLLLQNNSGTKLQKRL